MISPTLREFIAAELKVAAEELKDADRLQHELGLDGDDASAFMARFAERFDIDMSNFDSADYFGRERAGCIPMWIVWIVIPPLRPKVTPITLADLQKSVKAKKWKRPRKSSEVLSPKS
jgi:hypothetical protein